MSRLPGSQRTLHLTLRARAHEHTRPDRLFADPTAAAWVAQLSPPPAELRTLLSPGFQTGFAVRTRLYDDALSAWAADIPQPLVVELGGGLTTRPHRLKHLNAHWLIVDLPEALALRRELEGEAPHITLCPGDLTTPGWLSCLPTAHPPAHIAFIAEGVLLFLPPPAVHSLLAALKGAAAGATLLCDAAGHALRQRQGKAFAGVGAPIGWTVTDESDLEALGLDVLTVWPALAHFPKRWGDLVPRPLPPKLRSNSLVLLIRL